ncbi:MAG: ZIP family metal transporter [bacterium]|nr:ZIP family metal transporter [bacterium]
MIWQILAYSFIGSVGGLVGGILLALRKKALSHAQSLLMISFAAGVMLATAFFDLLPEAAAMGKELMFGWILAGVIFLFLLEKSLLWHHHHGDDCVDNKEKHSTPLMVNVGDTVHNFIDGLVMGAAVVANPGLGAVTALAVMAHEIPHEMADFGVMLAGGWSRRRTIVMNLISALAALIGAVLVYFVGTQIEGILPTLLFFAGGMFIYLACSDLIPELHHAHLHHEVKNNSAQILVFVAGIVLIYVLIRLLEG